MKSKECRMFLYPFIIGLAMLLIVTVSAYWASSDSVGIANSIYEISESGKSIELTQGTVINKKLGGNAAFNIEINIGDKVVEAHTGGSVYVNTNLGDEVYAVKYNNYGEDGFFVINNEAALHLKTLLDPNKIVTKWE